MSENVHSAAGYEYYPEAFDSGIYELASKIVNDKRFYRIFVSYFLKTMLDPTQLVHARSSIVNEVQSLAPHSSIIKTVWCSLSLATEKYFNEKALDYAWSDEEKEEAQRDWFGLIAPGFIPGDYNRSLDISVIKAWKSRLVKLLGRDMGPMAACDMCTSKCLYSYDVKALDDNWVQKFDKARQRENAAATTAHMALSMCVNLTFKIDIDLAFCITARTVQHQDTFEDAQHDFMEKVRIEMEKIIARENKAAEERKEIEKSKKRTAATAELMPPSRDGSVPAAKTAPPQDYQKDKSNKPEISDQEILSKLGPKPKTNIPPEGSLSRDQLFEVIVRIGLTGAKWRTLCEETILANQLSADEIEQEIQRRLKNVNCEPENQG